MAGRPGSSACWRCCGASVSGCVWLRTRAPRPLRDALSANEWLCIRIDTLGNTLERTRVQCRRDERNHKPSAGPLLPSKCSPRPPNIARTPPISRPDFVDADALPNFYGRQCPSQLPYEA
ncbi:uncharacterized protein TRAVEDRAFT_29350 [Trametes versicolor FP-101664 SS1]|uniref:uncharacterized protein n=1 Tax=Trametes versicolor (strain FP-101664) TaxID=717944 RepID=UPI0004622918|nr:uncharacterized protein TRAVEDRAFT_29350 [Trametes versicolor FP-101664 SS1]EIW57137.1 hypothetical protein TRAVEDRAFT_29350 [Trametes versicolor FP-101664 SS1]